MDSTVITVTVTVPVPVSFSDNELECEFTNGYKTQQYPSNCTS